ncbi:MAG: CBS domain-containing protein [Treponema sp.]|nr:CBS domain-containing protein [Treponema sp.]
MQAVMDAGSEIEQMFRSVNKICVGDLAKSGFYFSPDEKTEHIYESIKNNPAITEFAVVEDNAAIGFLTRTAFSELLGGQYGFTLYSKCPVREIMKTDFLTVDYDMSIDQVSSLAMQRLPEELYDPVVVKRGEKYFGIVVIKDLLDTSTKIALSERNEIALMRDNLKIGLFFIDRSFSIQDQYSRYLEELFMQINLCGKNFIELLASSVTPKELDIIQDYLSMIFELTFAQDMLDDINPLTELHYTGITGTNQYGKKVFQFNFATIERNNGEVFALVSVYDITARVELQQRLTEEENMRHEEMASVFELIQVEPAVFSDFLADTEYEFDRIGEILKNDSMSAHEAVVAVYQSIHAIKSNAVILGLNTFCNKAHELESKLKMLREQEEIPLTDMFNLSIELEKLTCEKEKFETTIQKINSFKSGAGNTVGNAVGNTGAHSQAYHVLVESLTKTVNTICKDTNKNIRFLADEIEDEALEKGPRRTMKEVLMQLVRNSAVHGIESPQERSAIGKPETGTVRLSLKMANDIIHVKIKDDGRGLDFKKIAEKALQKKLIKPEDVRNADVLLKAMFLPGFSTAETEGIHAGRGIGLNLVQDRVRAEKGSIKVQTEPGKGTVFNIFFPKSKP